MQSPGRADQRFQGLRSDTWRSIELYCDRLEVGLVIFAGSERCGDADSEKGLAEYLYRIANESGTFKTGLKGNGA